MVERTCHHLDDELSATHRGKDFMGTQLGQGLVVVVMRRVEVWIGDVVGQGSMRESGVGAVRVHDRSVAGTFILHDRVVVAAALHGVGSPW